MEKTLKDIVQYVRKNYFSYWVILGIDTAISVLCSLVAYAVIHYMAHVPMTDWMLCKFACVSLVASVAGSLLFHTYRNTIRFSQARELWRIMCAVLFKIACLVIISFGVVYETQLPYNYKISYLLFDGLLTLVILTTFRVSLIIVYDFLLDWVNKKNTRILIYGTNEESVALKLRLRDSAHYKVTGFYVYGKNNSRRRLADLPVYYFENESDVDYIMRKRGIKGILFARYEDTRLEEKRLLEYCKNNELKILIAPTISEADSDGNFHQWVRPIKIEDLLGRAEININLRQVAEVFRGKVVLVTGAAGSIGSELCRQLVQMGIQKLIMFDSAETPLHNVRLEFEKKYPNIDFVPVIGDVRVKERVRMVFELYHPQIVFHAAAYKHVPLMEENPCEAVHTNVYGTHNVADMAVKYDVDKFIMISTDKAVNPTNVMGASKRLAEIYVQSLSVAISKGLHPGKTRFITTRFGNVLGSNGSVIPRFREQLAKGGPLTVTHPDIIRYFMTIPEACRLVLEAAFMGKGNEIFVFDMGTPVKIADLARRMIELAGLVPDKDIEIQYTGLRPGEKLYEELLAIKENTLPTLNEKIYRAQVREYDFKEINELMDPLVHLAVCVDKVRTVKLMKEIVPEFKSKNSEYEALDK